MMRTHPQIHYTDHNSLKASTLSGNIIKRGKPSRWARFWTITERKYFKRTWPYTFQSHSYQGGLAPKKGSPCVDVSSSFIKKREVIRWGSCNFDQIHKSVHCTHGFSSFLLEHRLCLCLLKATCLVSSSSHILILVVITSFFPIYHCPLFFFSLSPSLPPSPSPSLSVSPPPTISLFLDSI